ncbi:M28 family peptidase [bacterium]|nr:MAG: M28 family peptidase [bacterium]
MIRHRWFRPILIALLILAVATVIFLVSGRKEIKFDGQRAYQEVLAQMALGPRTPGSVAHDQVVDWMVAELKGAGWDVEVQELEYQGQPVRNVIARRGSGTPWIILGAHYDSRLQADQDADPALKSQPVPGANDGASGVAVLLELARVLPAKTAKAGQIWLVFLDSEDQGDLPGWNWIYGSRAFVEQLEAAPSAFVLLDMIGDSDLNIYFEKNSDANLSRQIWETAASLGYRQQFIQEEKFRMLDDHIPFIQKGIPAVDLIDFDYPYWHTSQDTADKVSADSLEKVGQTLLVWLTTP